MHTEQNPSPTLTLSLIGLAALGGIATYLAVRKSSKSAATTPTPVSSGGTAPGGGHSGGGHSGGTSTGFDEEKATNATDMLNALGYDGVYDIRKFQEDWNVFYDKSGTVMSLFNAFQSVFTGELDSKAERLDEDGIIGPKTYAMLEKAFNIATGLLEVGDFNNQADAWQQLVGAAKG